MRIVIATSGAVDLAEWIIDDSCLDLICFSTTHFGFSPAMNLSNKNVPPMSRYATVEVPLEEFPECIDPKDLFPGSVSSATKIGQSYWVLLIVILLKTLNDMYI